MAIQLLRVLPPVTIVAADVDGKKLEQAKKLGADHIVNNPMRTKRPIGLGKSLDRAGLAWCWIVLVCNQLSIWACSCSAATVHGRSSAWVAAIMTSITAARRMAPQ
jgi:threonine dehydrogenase-like Zn-dependent dehydrogenase